MSKLTIESLMMLEDNEKEKHEEKRLIKRKKGSISRINKPNIVFNKPCSQNKSRYKY